jgi:putative restriction endonuclease
MPLDNKSVEILLLKNSFYFDHETQYIKRFYNKKINEFVYINKGSGKKNSTLIIHPKYELDRNEFLKILGVNDEVGFNKSSNMDKFPRKIFNGKTQIHYGIPLGFEDSLSCQRFLEKFTGKKSDVFIDEIDDFEKQKNDLLELTETERNAVVKSRIGQGIFRELLIDYWGKCSVSGFNFIPLLKASHIKPWRDSTNIERLDLNNGLLLTPNLDAVFDRGFIAFNDRGEILISSELPITTHNEFSIDQNLRLSKITNDHKKYLEYHRKFVFRP